MTITKSEILKVITDAALDRANRSDTGVVIWSYVVEDVKYFFRDEIADSAAFEAELSGEIFTFIHEYNKCATV